MKKQLPDKKKGILKSIRFLAYIHAFFFFSGSILLVFQGTRNSDLLVFAFLFNGILATICGYYTEKNDLVSGLTGMLTAFSYWLFSILAGLNYGFVKGISVSVTLLGILSLYHIFSYKKQ